MKGIQTLNYVLHKNIIVYWVDAHKKEILKNQTKRIYWSGFDSKIYFSF